MHTIENTDIGIIEKNWKSRPVEKNDKNCVLITTGSFNPIHRSHIYNLRLVIKHLENHKTKPMNVLAAYISPTHDSYVRNKLGYSDWIPADKRCELCEDAIKYENLEHLVCVSKGEVEQKRFVDFDEVTESLAEFLNSTQFEPDTLLPHPLKVVYVCGLDHFNKCSHVERLAKQDNIACAVIYRLGVFDDYIKRLEEESSNIYYITLEDERETLVDISSTAIRQRYRTLTDTDPDELAYPCVHDFYKEKYNKS